jgi:hypothetical protein
MPPDHFEAARTALEDGHPDRALRLAWKTVLPAVLAEDTDLLTQGIAFAERLADSTTGSVQGEAEQLASYCAACILEPRDAAPSSWSWKGMFSRRTPGRRKCPDCAEEIAIEARVCRFCGYRLDGPIES